MTDSDIDDTAMKLFHHLVDTHRDAVIEAVASRDDIEMEFY